MNQAYLLWLGALVACGGGGSAHVDAGAPADAAARDAPPPDARSVVGVLFVNELMPSNKTACADPFGEFDDWIELYNTGDTDLDLTGYYVTDDATRPMKHQLAPGVSVPAHGYKLLWADDQIEGADHLPFKLDAQGEAFAIYQPDGATLIDMYAYATATTDVSFARVPDATGAFVSCATSTCGASNGTACTAAR